ncbi:MAG TPA: ester cyclase [Ktedonobacteraceae bacterium]
MRIPATGKQIIVMGIYSARFAEGKAVEAWDQMDTLGLYQQLGMIPVAQPVG